MSFILSNDTMSSLIALQLFGPGMVVDVHGQVLALRSRKQLALMAYLAVEYRTVHSRRSLMALLWPDENVQSAQSNLRVTLSRLRELSGKIGMAVADLWLADRHTMQLHPN